MVIRHVGVWSVARLYGAFCAAMGLLFGLVFALVSLLGFGLASAAHSTDGGVSAPIMGAMFGVGAVIALPVFYGIVGLVMGAISAALYNLFAGLFGGIDIEAS